MRSSAPASTSAPAASGGARVPRQQPLLHRPRSVSTASAPSPVHKTKRGGGTWAAAPPPSSPPPPPGSGPAGAPGEQTQSAAASRRVLFNDIAPVYDQLNDLLSLGLHRVWKRMAVTWSGARPGDAALDVCCGSGDVALLLAAEVRAGGSVVGLDFAPAMLSDAARREAAAFGAGRGRSSAFSPGSAPAPIQWVEGDATALPFPDGTFDAATLSYGLRNVSDPAAALSELARVLKPGGRAAILDFNHSPNPVVDAVQAALLDRLVVPAARAAGVGPQYEYLRPSIAAFPTGPAQERLALEAGFAAAVHHEVGLGLMGCLVAVKAK